MKKLFWFWTIAIPSAPVLSLFVQDSRRQRPLGKRRSFTTFQAKYLTKDRSSPCTYALRRGATSLRLSSEDSDKKEKSNEDSDAIEPSPMAMSRTDAMRRILRQEQEVERILEQSSRTPDEIARRDLLINAAAGGLLLACGLAGSQLYQTSVYTPSGFRRLPSTQFIAALGEPSASEGVMSSSAPWGLWRLDPGPRGIYLRDYNNNQLPTGWTLDPHNWWLEEHGILMEAPEFPLPSGRYLVTGGRSVTTGLTVDAAGGWRLDQGTLFDVTHLPCRSARYRPQSSQGSPASANPNDFPVFPGAPMPMVKDCSKQDYAVLFLVGKAI